MRLLVPFLLAILAGCGKNTDPIILGHLDPKTGNDSQYRALQMLVDQTNADAASRPHERRINVIHASTENFKPEEVQGQSVRLAAVNKVFALIGGETAEHAERVGKSAQSEPLLAFTPSGWPGSPSNPHLVPVGIAPSEQGKFLAQYLLKSHKPSRIAVLVDDRSAAFRSAAEAFVAELKSAAITRVELPRRSENGDQDKLERERSVKRVQDAKPDALYLGVSARDALDWYDRIKQVKVEHVIFGGDEGDVPALREVPEQSMHWLYASAFSPDSTWERGAAFMKEFTEKYGQQPDAAAALAHDALSLFLQACREAPEVSTAKLREHLRKKDATFNTLTGSLRFAADGTARRPVFVVQIVKEGFKTLTWYEPTPDSPPAKQ